jgi:Fe2+ or Zn2+ uptake regulation protein
MGGEPYPFDWATLAPLLLHPLKVAIIEAMSQINRPISPAELHRHILAGESTSLSGTAYHVEKLVEIGVLEEVDSRPANGSTEHFFFFREQT